MVDILTLGSGNDIPFAEAGVSIHQPTLKEIGLIGESNFYPGCGILNFSQNDLSQTDRNNLGNLTNFEILMSMMLDSRNPSSQEYRIQATLVLTLIFPDYEIHFSGREIILKKEDEIHSINNENFEIFKEILTEMFCLKGRGEQQDYNPGGKAAKALVEKFNERRRKLAEQKKDESTGSVLFHLASIVSIGLKLNLNEVLNYTVYQLFDQYDRFDLFEKFDIHLKAQLAGARDLEEVDNWRKNIHP